MGIISGVVIAELLGFVFFFQTQNLLGIFVDTKQAIGFGTIHAQTVCFFFCLLAFSHCAAGVMRGCGKSVVPMITMLTFWCGFRILYVTVALRFVPVFRTISAAYPITWTCSSIVFAIFLLKSDWIHAFEKKNVHA